MIDAAIIGWGKVGQATGKALGIDKYCDIKGSTVTLAEAAKCRFVFICLPTPTRVDGRQDRTAIESVLGVIRDVRKTPIIVIRSTVLPGTNKYLKEKYGLEIVSNPEFGSEDTMDNDIRKPILVVIGGENRQTVKAVEEIYQDYDCPKIITDSVTAETIKYSLNSWFATKVVWGNMLYDLCQSSGADYERIKEVYELHPWVGKNHWEVRHKGYRGFGGSCLPKDCQAFLTYYYNRVLKTVIQENERIKGEK